MMSAQRFGSSVRFWASDGREDDGWFSTLWLERTAAAAVAVLCAFGFAATASPGMRSLMGLAEFPTETARLDEPKAPQEVVDIVQLRCMMCHAAEPMEEIGEAPKGVLLDTPEHIARFAPAILQQAVLNHTMPPNNFSQMTDDERRTLARWLGVETAQK